MIRINQLMTGRRHVSQYSQPAEGINTLESLQRSLRDALSADSMITIAAGDEIAGELMCAAIVPIAHFRVCTAELADANLCRLELELGAGRRARVDQILGDFRLP